MTHTQPLPEGESPAFLPVNLCLHRLSIALIGRGDALAARYRKLKEAGARGLSVYGEPPEGWRVLPDDTFTPGYLLDAEVITFRVVMLAEAPEEITIRLAEACRAAGVLVNAEDVIPWCDFYFMSVVRRGDLTLGVGTGGGGPAAAVMIREFLEEAFPPEWAERLQEAAALRLRMRAQGATKAEVIRAVRAQVKAFMPALACGECPAL